MENIKSNLIQNAYPPFLIDKVIKAYLNHKFSRFELPLSTIFPTILKIIFRKFANNFDPVPDNLKAFLVYKYTCASCSFSYMDKTYLHFKTRIGEHIKKYNKSHIFKHLYSTTTCFDSYNSLSFKIIDKTNSKYDLKIKEALRSKN